MAERVVNVGTDDYRRPPSTQSGGTQDLSAKHVQENGPAAAQEINIGPGPDQSPASTPVTPPTASFGAGSIGSNVEGWHPGK